MYLAICKPFFTNETSLEKLSLYQFSEGCSMPMLHEQSFPLVCHAV
uniref:Uncharacterized protein n=1 Tax=Rhizophora mucronata TaxID=61149 RepID=A0A2P2NC84_RHIMU